MATVRWRSSYDSVAIDVGGESAHPVYWAQRFTGW